MTVSRIKLLCCAWLALGFASAAAQQVREPALGNAALARLRSARFLAERGLGTPIKEPMRAGVPPARTLSEARGQFLQAAPLAAGASGTVPTWTSDGPNQVFNSAYGFVAGRVTSIAVDSSDTSGNTVYLGTASGGVWKSNNATSSLITFVPETDRVFSSQITTQLSSSLSIGAVSVQPVPPGTTSPVILAGTGDPNDTTASYFGSGILRSTNGGADWTLITQSSDASNGGNSNFSFLGNGFAGFAWGTVLGNPVVVAAVSQAQQGVEVNAEAVQQSILGIYYSTDLGQTWYMATISDCIAGATCSNPAGEIVQSPQTFFSPCSSPAARLPCGNAVTSVVWNPVRKAFIAAVRFHGYYASTDGQNWYRLGSQPGANLTTTLCPSVPGYSGSTSCPIYNGTLAVQPVTGDTFALTTDINNLDQGLWQDACSAASGACASSTLSFAQLNDSALDCSSTNAPNCAAGNAQPTLIPQADYDLYLAAVPYQNGSTSDTLLFAGTADIYRCDLGMGCAWRNTTHAQSFDCNAAHVAPAQYAIDATLAASGVIYFGNAGGLWRTPDLVNQTQPQCSADDASHFQNLNSAFTESIAEVDDLAFSPSNPQAMMLSLGPLGTAAPIPGTSSPSSWEQALNGEGDYAAIDPVASSNWYATSEFGIGINRCTQGASCDISSFGSPIIDSADVGYDGYGQVIPAPWILDPQNTSNLILGTCRVWWGPATGGALTAVSSMLDNVNNGSNCNGNAEIRSLAASGGAAGKPERIYAGMAGLFDGGSTEAGQVFEQTITNGAPASTQWIDLSNDLNNFNPNGFDISSIYVDPHTANGQTVYVTVQGFGSLHLYRTVDGGNNWQDISSDLPNVPANSAVVDPNNANIVYVATDAGVYSTQNVAVCSQPRSNCWSAFGSGLPNVPVTMLAVENGSSSSPSLLAATYGRGLWQVGLATVTTTTAAANPTSLTFPNQAVGTSSAPQQALITNTGTVPLTTSSISTAGDFTESDTCMGQSIAPGDACIIEVTFAPTQTGARSGTLTLYANLAGGGQLVIPLNGTGTPGASVTLTPTALCFAATLIGQTTSTPCGSATSPSQPGGGSVQPGQAIVIANTGGSSATLSSVKLTSGLSDFSIVANTCGASLAAANTTGDSCTVSIAFTPSASGNRAGALTVVSSAGTLTAQLVGTGQSPATDALSPTGLSFGSEPVGSSTQPQYITMTNSGGQAVQDITVQSSSGSFVPANNCGASLAAGASCAIAVSFAPVSTGPQTAVITVSDNLHPQGQQVTATGTGTAPAGVASASPLTMNFGYYAVGKVDPNVYSITVTNNGSSVISGMQFSVTTGASDFSAQSGSSNPCEAGGSLAIGASCNIAVTFAPTKVNQLNGSVAISGTNLTALSVALTGYGAEFQVTAQSMLLIPGGQTSGSIPVTISSSQGGTGPVSLTCSVAPASGTCSFSPTSALTTTTVMLTSGATQSATVTFTAGTQSRAGGFTRFPWSGAALTLAMLLPVGFLGRRGRRWRALLVCFVAALLLPMGCGVSSSAGSSGGSTGEGGGTTPPSGSYTVTITGTMDATVQNSATLTPGDTSAAATQVTVE